MKIVVMGSGITGILSAVAIKKHCPEHEVCLIDSDREPVNLGFGESAPPQMPMLLMRALKISNDQWPQWFREFIAGTKSTIKFNLKWQNFLGESDQGYYSGIADMPSYYAMFETSHTKKYLPDELVFPDHNEYKITDLWYELYRAGRRKLSDFEGDINPFYWHSVNRKWIGHSGLDGTIRSLASWPTIHLNSAWVATWLKSTYNAVLDQVIVGTIDNIEHDDKSSITQVVLDSGQSVKGDLYLDCTGFKRLTAKRFGHTIKPVNTSIKHDRAVIVANGYTKHIDQEMQPYTSGFGMQAGWTFSVPLLDRKSYGYVFDSAFVSPDQAFEEIASLSDPATRVIERIDLQWTPGCFAKSWSNNYVMLGLASGFVDAFDANTIGINFLQIFNLIEILKNHSNNLRPQQDIYNLKIEKYFNLISERVEMHFGLAPRSTSEYWHRNHQVAKDKKLEDRTFDVFDNPKHSLAAHYRGIGQPYMAHLYLSNSIYYDIDMSRRCKNSSAQVLDFAEEYFRSFNTLNRMRSELAPTMREWYQQQGIDLDLYVSF